MQSTDKTKDSGYARDLMNSVPVVIVALDYEKEIDCLNFLEKIDPKLCAVKIGLSLYTASGPALVKACVARGFRVFLDLKFHDIPNTVATALRVATDLGVFMVNVHASGGPAMLEAARSAIIKDQGPLLIAVTVLTSHDNYELTATGIKHPLNIQVENLAGLAFAAGLDGVVCSPLEVNFLKQKFGNKFITVTPGIRLSEDNKNDQKRTMTHLEAKNAGSDYLVIGRSITQSQDPLNKLKQILKDLHGE